MSTVLVTGGTGVLGRLIVERFQQTEHDVRVLSRRPGAGTHVGQLSTGEGIAEAAAGADIIVHAATDSRRQGKPDLAATETLLAAAPDVAHLLYVSIVGIEHIPYKYYQNKLACERSITASGIPHTILRATQFHELIAALLHTMGRWPIAPLPTNFQCQPIAATEVAAKIVSLTNGEPQGLAPDFGGPEVLTFRDMIDTWQDSGRKPRRILPIRLPGRIAAGFRTGANTCPNHTDGQQTWPQFVAANPTNAYQRGT